MYIELPDPDPGRCLNARWDPRTHQSYRCTQYEGVPHICKFNIPVEVTTGGGWLSQAITTTAVTPKRWVRPEDR